MGWGKEWGYWDKITYLKSSKGEQSNPAGAVDQGSVGFELLMGKPCRGEEHRRGPIPCKARAYTRLWRTSKIKVPTSIPLVGGEIFSDPIGLTWKHDILVLKPSPCLHNGSQVYDWMGLNEWNSWFKSETQTGA
ncbi:uncharacterized protein TNCV_2173631 [Trichonephila clavipes]|nr:uncharacterized protein TNCV_2173631 [Trichonephila clavipes]